MQRNNLMNDHITEGKQKLQQFHSVIVSIIRLTRVKLLKMMNHRVHRDHRGGEQLWNHKVEFIFWGAAAFGAFLAAWPKMNSKATRASSQISHFCEYSQKLINVID